MSPDTPRPGRLRTLQLSAIVWLTLVWVGLWGSISPMVVAGGVIVAVIVCLVFPLPPLEMHLRVHPVHLAWLVIRFLWDVLVASAHVAWVTLRFHQQPRNAVIEVDLTTNSDFVLTIVGEMVSLVPGSLVVEARRSTHTLFLHVLDARDDAGVEKMRSQVFAQEQRVLRAFGSPQGVTPATDVPTEEASP